VGTTYVTPSNVVVLPLAARVKVFSAAEITVKVVPCTAETIATLVIYLGDERVVFTGDDPFVLVLVMMMMRRGRSSDYECFTVKGGGTSFMSFSGKGHDWSMREGNHGNRCCCTFHS